MEFSRAFTGNSFILYVIQWVPEVSNACPGVPYLLIGCKNDLRTDSALQLHLTVPGQEPEESDSISRMQVCVAHLSDASAQSKIYSIAFVTALRVARIPSTHLCLNLV